MLFFLHGGVPAWCFVQGCDTGVGNARAVVLKVEAEGK